MNRTVVMCFFEAFPPCSGAASVAYNCASHLPGERFLLQLGPKRKEIVTPDGVRVIQLPIPRHRVGKLCSMLWRIREMASLCREIQPDVIVIEGASWAVYAWLLMTKLRRKSNALLVFHAHNVEAVLRKIKHGAVVNALTRWAENKLIHYSDLAFAVSSVDQLQFEQYYGRKPDVLPNGVDSASFGAATLDELEAVRKKYGLGTEVLLFMGLYTYLPNTEAVDLLIQRIVPKIREKREDVQLAVLGGEIPYRQPWLVAPGSISHDELPAFVAACRIGVAPINSGSGTRLKILEYMASGLPVVSTAKGAEGLEVAANEHICIAETSDEFAAELLRLLEDRDRAVQLATAGQQRVRERYAWPRIMGEFWLKIQESLSAKCNVSDGY